MTYLKNYPSQGNKVVSQTKATRDAFSYLEGCFMGRLNDTNHELVGKERPKEYVQKVGASDSSSGVKGKVTAKLNYTVKNNKIEVKVIQQINKMPINGAKLSLYAKRNFGWLPLDEIRSSNSLGIITFNYPNDLPGDKDGNVNVKINMANADGTEQTIIDTIIKTEVKRSQYNLLDNRTMWNVRSMAPIWLVLSYCGAVLAAWGVIFYIIWILLRIRKSGSETSN